MDLVAFSGAMFTGKTTAARYLSMKYGFESISFADRLKLIVSKITPDGRIDKFRDRALLQFLATEYYRSIDIDFWVRPVAQFIDKCFSLGKNVVVDDPRFENEFEMLKSKGAIFIHILSDEDDIKARANERDKGYNPGIKEHVSENAIGRIYENELVYNNSTKEKFIAQLDDVYNLHRKRPYG